MGEAEHSNLFDAERDPSHAAANARHVTSEEWTQFESFYYVTCCDCGLSHRVDVRVAPGGYEARHWRMDEYTNEMRRQRDFPEISARDSRIAELTQQRSDLIATTAERVASLESQLSGAVAEQERLREALLGKRLAHELTDLMARLLHYQNGDEPRWADMPYEALRKEWDELPEPIVSRYRNDFKFNAQVSRAVARIRDTICAALRPAEASHD